METLLYRLRKEPALVLGAIASTFSFISTLPAGATWASLIPVVTAAILRQFVSTDATVRQAETVAYIEGRSDSQDDDPRPADGELESGADTNQITVADLLPALAMLAGHARVGLIDPAVLREIGAAFGLKQTA